MALYTMLFSEWLAGGGQMPAAFSEIDDFENLFKARFADREIGFETPALFELKLNAYAALYIPVYAARITALEAALSDVSAPEKVRVRTGKISREYGEQNAAQTDMPTSIPPVINPAGINGYYSPSVVNTAKSHTDTESYDDVTEKESGVSVAEAVERLKALSDIRVIKEELLELFQPLFMGVY